MQLAITVLVVLVVLIVAAIVAARVQGTRRERQQHKAAEHRREAEIRASNADRREAEAEERAARARREEAMAREQAARAQQDREAADEQRASAERIDPEQRDEDRVHLRAEDATTPPTEARNTDMSTVNRSPADRPDRRGSVDQTQQRAGDDRDHDEDRGPVRGLAYRLLGRR